MEPDSPSLLLVTNLHRLPQGRALDIAMGRGRHALYLARHGWEVEGLERDPQAIADCLAQARAQGIRSIIVREVDLEQYLLPVDQYDVILCFYYLQRSLLPQIAKALRPGGVLIYETFLLENHERFGHPRRKEFCFAPGELAAAFRDLEPLHVFEGAIREDLFVSQLIARCPAG